MNIQDLKSNTTWQEASNTINNNNNKISLAIATLENAKLKNKGYFTSVEKLKAAVPNPTIGSKAYVGTSEPYAIYIVENGVWVDSGYTGGDEIVAKITTDRIENGAVISEKIATSAFDNTLSISGKIAPADVVGGKLSELDDIINGGSSDYQEITPEVINDRYVNYIGDLKTPSSSGIYGLSYVTLTKGQSVKISAYGNTAMMPIGKRLTETTFEKVNNIEAYSADKTLETYEYTAEDDCMLAISFRIGSKYPHHIYRKNPSVSGGIVAQLENKIDEAPNDGKSYARKNKTWQEVSNEEGGGINLTSINIVPSDNWVNGSMLSDGTIRDDRTYGTRSKTPISVNGGEAIVLMTNSDLPEGVKVYEYLDDTYSKTSLITQKQVRQGESFNLQLSTKFIVLMISREDLITTINYMQYASMIGFAYSNTPIKFQEYNKNVIGKQYEIEGVHKHTPKLKWIAMGDSITDGSYSTTSSGAGGDDAGGFDKRETCWAKRVADINGYELTNVGIGGTGWLKKGAQGDRKNAKEQVADYNFADYDIVTLAFGINDWKSTTQEDYGEIIDDKTANTIVGAMKYCIEKILADNPYIRIIVITPMNCHSGTFETNYAIGKTVHGHTLADMFNIMKSVCEFYTIPYIDMTYKGIINRCNVLQICGDGLPADDPNRDNVHPTLEGHKRMAYIISQEMKYNS